MYNIPYGLILKKKGKNIIYLKKQREREGERERLEL
jgi:hypothetical protein